MGLDLGLEAAGFKTSVALEKNKIAVETIKLNKGNDFPVIEKPIEEVTTEKLLELAKLKPKEASVLIGGPCCQSFSTAGKRQSLGDATRGQLFRHFKRIVSEAKPRFFVMENVKGMLSAAVQHRPLNERGHGFPPLAPEEELGSALKVICSDLAELNYKIIFGLVNCADYGVPQKRYRVIFIGSRDGENIAMPVPSHSDETSEGKPAWVTLKEALHGLDQEKVEFLPLTKDRKELLIHLKAGQNWQDLPRRLHRAALGAAADSWGGRSGFCRRLAWDEPAPTLTTDPNGRATMLCHPSKLRPLSVQEYATLQQFPATWKFSGITSQKYLQIGNAVPIGLGSAIGKALLKTIRHTEKHGLPADASLTLGKVVCADPELEQRLKNRKKTMLHPAHLRKNPNPQAAREWLTLIAA